MVTYEQVVAYYKKNYHNHKLATNLNINKCLWIDYQKFCLDLSRQERDKISPSSRIRLLMVKDILENQKHE